MFERYTEKARRVVLFARFEASQYGSQYIETEHLLLGLMRENFPLMSSMIGYGISVDGIRREIEKHVQHGERFSTAVEVPLSAESKRVLTHAADEADRLGHRHIGTEHMLLGLLREKEAHAAVILRQHGADIAAIRLKLAGSASPYREPTKLADGTYLYRAPSTPAGDAMVTLTSFLSGLRLKPRQSSPTFSLRMASSSIFPAKCGSAAKKLRPHSRDCSRRMQKRIRPIASSEPFRSARRQCWHQSYGRTQCTRIKHPGPYCE